MKCEICGGAKLVRFRMFDLEHLSPCPNLECHAGEVSCCEGSERHGQLGPGDEETKVKWQARFSVW